MKTNKTILKVIATLLFLFITTPNTFAEEENGTADKKRVSLEYEIDPYYSSIDLFISLTDKPIPDVGEKEEVEIYKDLLYSSHIPQFLLLEASVNPLPSLGVYLKDRNLDTYNRGEISPNFNLIKAMTAGFEEPHALSVFFGNVLNFVTPGEDRLYGNKGYMGYLFSMGNYHIKDNVLINDNWYEIEWKIKGDRKTPTSRLNWSFRIGGKLHENTEIRNILYFSIRRSRIDYEASPAAILRNSGFEYTADVSTKNYDVMRHYFFVDKKWPWKRIGTAFSIAVGFVWESDQKYSGSLKEKGKRDDFQFILRPNISF
ncbi:MAG TPA: hypothetical protein DCY98_08615 [Nitrospinae bacterium]|nr:hypothetical protein [Nitrospinota bacterium]